jgi:hypothetical protein
MPNGKNSSAAGHSHRHPSRKGMHVKGADGGACAPASMCIRYIRECTTGTHASGSVDLHAPSANNNNLTTTHGT